MVVAWRRGMDLATRALVVLSGVTPAGSGVAPGGYQRPHTMTLTKSFKDLVQSRVARDPDFAAALLREGIDTMLTGDVDTGRAILRDYIKATVGFENLAEATGTPPKNLIRMFGPSGNPRARNLFGVIGYLQKQAGIELHVAAGPV